MVTSTLNRETSTIERASPYLLPLCNDEIADALEQVADLLDVQDSNPHRIRAYRRGARTIQSLDTPLTKLFEREGRAGLENLPGIGKGLSGAIAEFIQTGRFNRLEQLQEEVPPEALFVTIPGIGEKLAHQIHKDLGIETLEALELAAHDGSLENVHGFGPRRTRLVRDTLDSMLDRSGRYRARRERWQDTQPMPVHPSVALILEVDRQYRTLARAGKLTAIAPRRFNPDGKRWLPIMHMMQEGWLFTALYSNTARAHDLNKTHDWVVIYYERDGAEAQCTVVTETHGSLRGQRVVRGREAECKSA